MGCGTGGSGPRALRVLEGVEPLFAGVEGVRAAAGKAHIRESRQGARRPGASLRVVESKRRLTRPT